MTSITDSFATRCRREALVIEFYQPCSRTLPSVATIQGARRASGQTNTRAASTRKIPTSVPAARHPLLAGFIHQGGPSPCATNTIKQENTLYRRPEPCRIVHSSLGPHLY